MVTKKFILPDLAIGAMLIESVYVHAQTPSFDLETSPSSGIKSIQINGGELVQLLSSSPTILVANPIWLQ